VIVSEEGECFGDGQAPVAGAAVEGFIDGLAGRREHQHLFARPMRRGAQRGQGVCFARARGRGQRLHEER